MNARQTISGLLSEGALGDAVGAATAAVKAQPQDAMLRVLLCDLTILQGDFERADRQLVVAASMRPEDSVGLSVLRRQISAMHARAEWFSSGAVPSFLGEPTAMDRAALRMQLALANGEVEVARGCREALEAERASVPALVDGIEVDDIRDLDDRIPHALEVLTAGGSYLWVGLETLRSLAFEPIARPRDIAFRPAMLELSDGSAATVLVPMLYPATAEDDDDVRLGRRTDWAELAGGIVAGRGQRCLLAGESDVVLSQLRRIERRDASA